MTIPAPTVPVPDPPTPAPESLGCAAPGGGDFMPEPLYALIAQQPFFQGLNARLLRLLTASAMDMRFVPGQLIFQEGSPANRFYLIMEGKVVLETVVEEHGIIPIQTLGPGDDLGWSWLIPPYSLQLTARALESTRMIFFYGTRLREQCEHDHEMGYQLMQRCAEVMVKHLQATQQRLLECIVTKQRSPR